MTTTTTTTMKRMQRRQASCYGKSKRLPTENGYVKDNPSDIKICMPQTTGYGTTRGCQRKTRQQYRAKEKKDKYLRRRIRTTSPEESWAKFSRRLPLQNLSHKIPKRTSKCITSVHSPDDQNNDDDVVAALEWLCRYRRARRYANGQAERHRHRTRRMLHGNHRSKRRVDNKK